MKQILHFVVFEELRFRWSYTLHAAHMVTGLMCPCQLRISRLLRPRLVVVVPRDNQSVYLTSRAAKPSRQVALPLRAALRPAQDCSTIISVLMAEGKVASSRRNSSCRSTWSERRSAQKG